MKAMENEAVDVLFGFSLSSGFSVSWNSVGKMCLLWYTYIESSPLGIKMFQTEFVFFPSKYSLCLCFGSFYEICFMLCLLRELIELLEVNVI